MSIPSESPLDQTRVNCAYISMLLVLMKVACAQCALPRNVKPTPPGQTRPFVSARNIHTPAFYSNASETLPSQARSSDGHGVASISDQNCSQAPPLLHISFSVTPAFSFFT